MLTYLKFQKELAGLYLKSGMKNVGIMFLMTDAQVPSEQFLVLINDLLASGEIPDLFPDDEVENILAGVRNEVKGAGLVDTRENCWKFFIDRVRRQMKGKWKLMFSKCSIFIVFLLASCFMFFTRRKYIEG